jgi:phosphohistidine phosphatase
MDLYIIRHAWAFDRDLSRWPDDDLRPLADEGKKRFADFVEKLVERRVTPQAIASSPLVRCVQTAKILATGIPEKPKIEELDELRPSSDLTGLLRWTVRQSKDFNQIAWVGHAPDVGRLTAELIGESEGRIHFSKGAVAAIRFNEPPARQLGELRWLVTAKLLGE